MDALAFTSGWETALAILIEWGIAGLVLRQIHLKYLNLRMSLPELCFMDRQGIGDDVAWLVGCPKD